MTDAPLSVTSPLFRTHANGNEYKKVRDSNQKCPELQKRAVFMGNAVAKGPKGDRRLHDMIRARIKESSRGRIAIPSGVLDTIPFPGRPPWPWEGASEQPEQSRQRTQTSATDRRGSAPPTSLRQKPLRSSCSFLNVLPALPSDSRML